MTYARVFWAGRSQAVRLPKEFQVASARLEIFRRGEDIVLREQPVNATVIFDTLVEMPADFITASRSDDAPQERGVT